MRPARFIVAATLLALVVASATTSARSAETTRLRGAVKFYLDVRYPQPPGVGTFATSGAFTDSGTFIGYSAGAAPFGKVRIWRRFAGRKGSIVIQDIFSSPETGSWTILSGTGVYAGLHGRGTSIGMGIGTDVPANILPPKRAIGVATGTVS
jgi:hypothetical protein